MSKIIIVGAGIGGLLTAYNLGKAGFEVVVYEKNCYEKLSYDWHDDVSPESLTTRLGFSIDSEVKYHIKENMSFLFPGSDLIIKLDIPKNEREFSIERREFSHLLVKRASKYSTILFNKKVSAPIIKDNKIVGVIVDDKEEYADFVVDNSGAYSPLRSALPNKFCISNISDNDILFAFRGFYKATKNVDMPLNINKCYLRHLGQDGVSWVNVDEEGQVDVLIGRMKILDINQAFEVLSQLKKENPIIGDELIRGGFISRIPVRYPITKMFCNGYALIGDSAFMTIPMLGSGIEASIFAANKLSETLLNSDFSENNLYKYQKAFYLGMGAKFCEIDIIKRFLLHSKDKDLLFMVKNGVVSKEDMTNIYCAKSLHYSFKEIINKALKGISNPILLIKLYGMLSKIKKISKIMNKIPKDYNEEELNKWQNKVSKFFKVKE